MRRKKSGFTFFLVRLQCISAWRVNFSLNSRLESWKSMQETVKLVQRLKNKKLKSLSAEVCGSKVIECSLFNSFVSPFNDPPKSRRGVCLLRLSPSVALRHQLNALQRQTDWKFLNLNLDIYFSSVDAN